MLTNKEKADALWALYLKAEPGSAEAIALLDAYLYLWSMETAEGHYKPRHAVLSDKGVELCQY